MNLIRAHEEFLISAVNLPKVHHNKTIESMWYYEASKKHKQITARKTINYKIKGTAESIVTKDEASNYYLIYVKTNNKKKRKRRSNYSLK